MTIIVETGVGLSNAESYVSEAEASAYHATRGNVAWDAIDDKETLLRKATDYMVQTYRSKWKGYRTGAVQALDWPRSEVAVGDIGGPADYYIANNVVPVEIRRVCADLALRAATEDLLPDQTQQVVRETVGPLTVQYSPHAAQTKRFPAIDRALAPFIHGNSVSAQVRRV